MVLRIGLDLTWYERNGFGSLHGVNPQDGAAVYNYLTHGWKTSGGVSGGFFTAYSYEIHSPPLYPPQYPADRNWILAFINAANADNSGQKAKIWVRFVLECNFDATMVGTFWDFCKRLGTADKNPAVVGFGFRGAQEGILTGGGGLCNGGSNGPNFISSEVAYGPSGMNSWPQNATQFQQMWGQLQTIANAYGYKLGVSTGLSNMDNFLGQSVINSAAQWFIQDQTILPNVTASPSNSYTQNYNAFYNIMTKPPRAPTVSKGCVNGMWDSNFFYLGSSYGITQAGIQSSLQGASAGYAALNTTDDRYWLLYGMPALTNDNGAKVSPFMPWLYQYATQYGLFTDYSPIPTAPVISPVTPPIPPSWIPTGSYIAILGDASLHSQGPSYSQTDPVYCCGADTYTISGALTRLDTNAYVGGKTIAIMIFDYTQCKWIPLVDPKTGKTVTATTTPSAPSGKNTNWGPITVYSPPLPNTKRNQAYFYSAFLGDASYGASNGVLEDLPILPHQIATSLSLNVTQT